MKKLIALVVLSCASLWAQTLILHNGNKGSNQEFKPGPAGLIIENIDGTTDQIGKDLIGGSTIGKCITTVANLSGVCGTTTGQVATVTDATGASDCTTGLSTNVALCIYNGTTWVAGGGGSGTVTNIATTSPITGGAITTTGTIACATCTTAASALTANGIVKGSGGQAEAVSTVASDDGTTLTYTGTGGVLASGTGGLKAGANGGAAGVVSLNGSTSGTATLTAPAAAGTVTNAVTGSNQLNVPGLGLVTQAPAGGQTGIFNNASTNIVLQSGGTTWMTGTANQVATNKLLVPSGGNKLFVTSNFTTAANTNLQTITGLAFTNNASNANNWNFHCALVYSQATAAAAVAFGIQAATNAPTNIFATGTEQITVGPPATVVTGTLATLTTTTATAIVSGTPGAQATNYTVYLDGTLELAASANTINFMVSTATSGDAVTVLRGSYCELF